MSRTSLSLLYIALIDQQPDQRIDIDPFRAISQIAGFVLKDKLSINYILYLLIICLYSDSIIVTVWLIPFAYYQYPTPAVQAFPQLSRSGNLNNLVELIFRRFANLILSLVAFTSRLVSIAIIRFRYTLYRERFN